MKILKYLLGAAVVVALSAACSSKTESAKADESAAPEATENTEAAPVTADGVIELKKGETLPVAQGKPVIIDFNATWCGPCRKFTPIFEEAAKKYAGQALFYAVDVDVHPEIAAQYGVESIPQVSYVAADGAVTKDVGLMTAEDFDARVSALVK